MTKKKKRVEPPQPTKRDINSPEVFSEAAHWYRWRKTTNNLIDILDRGLRKLEERTDVLEKADHGSFVAALSKLEEEFVNLNSRHVALNQSVGTTNGALDSLKELVQQIDKAWRDSVLQQWTAFDIRLKRLEGDKQPGENEGTEQSDTLPPPFAYEGIWVVRVKTGKPVQFIHHLRDIG